MAEQKARMGFNNFSMYQPYRKYGISRLAVFLSFFLIVNPAYAASVNLSDEEINARLDSVTETLALQKLDADKWEYGWGAFDGGTMIWSTLQAVHDQDHRTRATDIVQAGESLIGLADVIFRPLPAFDADSACGDIDVIEKNGPQCLAAKEALLQQSAERARDPYELLPHLENAGFNLAAGMIVWRVGGGGRALATAIPGEIIGEIQLWTVPSEPISDFDRYIVKFSPLLIQTESSRNPAVGLTATFRF